jgi:hypothetical protein
MPIDASRNPYDAPRFDAGAGKAVRPDEVAKDDLDDDLDGALDDLGATKGAVAADDLAADADDPSGDPAGDDLDLAGTGAKGAFALDDDLAGGDVKALAGDLAAPDGPDDLVGLKGDVDGLGDADGLDDIGAAKGGAFDVDDDLDGDDAFAADLGEVPDLDAKDDDLFDDDHAIVEQKGSILDAVADAMKDGLD